MGIKHSVPDQVKPSFVIFDIWAVWRSAMSVRVPSCQKFSNGSLTRSGTGCFIAIPITHMATVDVNGFKLFDSGRIL